MLFKIALLVQCVVMHIVMGNSDPVLTLVVPNPPYFDIGRTCTLTCNSFASSETIREGYFSANGSMLTQEHGQYQLRDGVMVFQFSNIQAEYDATTIRCHVNTTHSVNVSSNTITLFSREPSMKEVSTEPVTVPGTPTPVPTPTSTSDLYTSEGSTIDLAMKFTQTVEASITAKVEVQQGSGHNGALIGGAIFGVVAVIGLFAVSMVLVMILFRRNKRKTSTKSVTQNQDQNGGLNADRSQMETGNGDRRTTTERPVYCSFSPERIDAQHYEYLKTEPKPLQDSLSPAVDTLSLTPKEQSQGTQRGQMIGQLNKVTRVDSQPRPSTSRQLKVNTDSYQAPLNTAEIHRLSSTAGADVTQKPEHTSVLPPEDDGPSGATMQEIGSSKYLVSFSSNAEPDTIH